MAGGIEPAGKKHTLAKLAAEHLTESDLEDFVASRSKRPRVIQPGECGTQQQGTLDSLLAKRGPAATA